jgi:hypothetical protein
MARLVPVLDDAEIRLLKSKAEARFYDACRQRLPANWLVLFSVPWIGTSLGGQPRDGEADFVIIVPGRGILVRPLGAGRRPTNTATST